MKTTRSRHSLLSLAIWFLAFGQATGQTIQFSASTLPIASGGYGHGASFGAYTRNGRPSIFVISYGTANYLYDNIGGYFNDIAGSAGVQFGTDHDRGMAAADYDNDGDIDIYIAAGYTGNVFWRNNGDDTFTDITSSSGTYMNGQGQGVAWGDVNNDGSLDLFVCQTEGGNRLFIQGGGSFYESGNFSAESGSLQPVFFDVNNDGHIDLLVTRRTGLNNLLYINGGGGSFDEQAGSWNIGFAGANSQGAAVGDYDRDGDLDVFICDYSGVNLLFRNMGGHFEEVGGAAGVRAGSSNNRGAVFGDFDDDGWPDIYVTRGGDNKMFRNNGNGTFTDVSSSSGANDGNDGYSPSIADYDNDGDLDIFFTNTGQNCVLLQNQGPFNKWIEFRLRGSGSNLNGIGTRLTAWLQGRPQTQAVIAGQGYLGTGSDLTVHFGLGSSNQLDSLVVQWPSGARDRLYHLAANQKLTLYEGSAPPRDTSPPQISAVSTNNVTANAAAIIWKTDENADSQVEYGRDTNYGSFSAVDGNLVTSHAVTLSNLAANTTYHFRVHSKDASGNAAVSNDFTFTTARDMQAPAISQVTTSNIKMTAATVSWNTDEPADSQIEYGHDANYGLLSNLDANLVNSHALTISNLAVGTTYHFRVHSKDASGNAAVSNDFTFTTARDTQAPAISQVAASNITMTAATVSWNTDEPADSQIEYGRDANYGSLSNLDANLVTSHALTISNLAVGTTYHFRVHSKDASGNAAVSNDFTFTTARDTQAPAISQVATSNITMTAATVSWNTDEPADSQIEYGRDTNYGSLSNLDTSLVTSHALTVSNLAAGTTYHFRVHSRDAAGNLALSNDFTFTTTRDTQAPAIFNITTTNIAATWAQINWNTDEPSTARIEYGPDSTSLANAVVDTALALAYTVTLTNLQPYTTYYFHIVAKDKTGNTATSQNHSFRTLPVLSRLVVFNGNAQTGNPGEILAAPLAVKIENSASAAMSNVQVEFRVISGGGRVIGQPACDSSVCVVASDQNGIASIKWRLGLVDSQKVRATVLEKPELTVIFTAKLKGPVSAVDEQVVSLPNAFALRNYPNPFHDFTRLEVALPTSGVISLKIFDLHGREVITLAEEWRNAGRHFFAWQGRTDRGEPLTSGVYFAVLRYQNQSAPRFAGTPASPIIVETQKIFYVK